MPGRPSPVTLLAAACADLLGQVDEPGVLGQLGRQRRRRHARAPTSEARATASG